MKKFVLWLIFANCVFRINSEKCLNVACVQASASILEKMNTDIDPCDDFYQFACNSFIENNFIADEDSTTDTMSVMNNHFQEILLKLLENDGNDRFKNLWKISKDLFSLCSDEGEYFVNFRIFVFHLIVNLISQ